MVVQIISFAGIFGYNLEMVMETNWIQVATTNGKGSLHENNN